MTPEKMAFYSGVASGLLSLIFNWTPRLRQRFDKLSSEQQQGAMLIMTFIIAVVINLYQGYPSADIKESLGVLAATFLSGAVSNQSIDRITPKPKEVRSRRAARKRKVVKE